MNFIKVAITFFLLALSSPSVWGDCPICMCQESESSNSSSEYERDVQDEQDNIKDEIKDAIDAVKEYADEMGKSVDASREALLLAVEQAYLIQKRTKALRDAVKGSSRIWDMRTLIAMGRLAVLEEKQRG